MIPWASSLGEALVETDLPGVSETLSVSAMAWICGARFLRRVSDASVLEHFLCGEADA